MKKIIFTISFLLMLMLFTFTASAEDRIIPHEGNILFPESDVYAVAVNGIKVPVRAERLMDTPGM